MQQEDEVPNAGAALTAMEILADMPSVTVCVAGDCDQVVGSELDDAC